MHPPSLRHVHLMGLQINGKPNRPLSWSDFFAFYFSDQTIVLWMVIGTFLGVGEIYYLLLKGKYIKSDRDFRKYF